MRDQANLVFALLLGACAVYDSSLNNGSTGGDGNATTTGDAGSPGAGGTDTGGASTSAGTNTGSTGAGGANGVGGASGAALAGSMGAGVGGNGGAGVSAGGARTGGAPGTMAAGGGSAGGGSPTGGAGGASTMDAGPKDATPDVGGGGGGGICAPGTCKRVFVSLLPPAPSGKLGSAVATDSFCQTAANAKSLGGTWKAWLSDSSTSPSARFTHATVSYRLLDGSTIASNWTSLTSGTLQHPINIHEDGTSLPAGTVYEVWTGTNPNGTFSTGNSCGDWTNNTASAPFGEVGVTDLANGGWTAIYQQACDRTTEHVYCFEQ
jgi:hypothetical protein